jgi:hypothetical protein
VDGHEEQVESVGAEGEKKGVGVLVVVVPERERGFEVLFGFRG